MPSKRRTSPRTPSQENSGRMGVNCWLHIRADRYWGLTPEERTLLARMWWLRPLVRTEKYVIRPSWRWSYRYVSIEHLRQDIERQDKATKEFLNFLAQMIADQVLEEWRASRKSGQVQSE